MNKELIDEERINTLDYLTTIKDTLAIVRETTELLTEMTQPILTDIELISPMLEVMEEMLKGEDKIIRRNIEVFVILFYYAPIKIVNGKFCDHNNLLTYVAGLLKISTPNLSYIRKTLMDSYNPIYNPYFYKKTNMVLEGMDVEMIQKQHYSDKKGSN